MPCAVNEHMLMILPYLRSIMCGSTVWQPRNTPLRWPLIWRAHSTSSVSRWPVLAPGPATLQMMSTLPLSLMTRATRSFHCWREVTSWVTARALPSAALISPAVISAPCPLKSAIQTSTPSAASILAVALPMPDAPPVTMAVFPPSPRSMMWSPKDDECGSTFDSAGREALDEIALYECEEDRQRHCGHHHAGVEQSPVDEILAAHRRPPDRQRP